MPSVTSCGRASRWSEVPPISARRRHGREPVGRRQGGARRVRVDADAGDDVGAVASTGVSSSVRMPAALRAADHDVVRPRSRAVTGSASARPVPITSASGAGPRSARRGGAAARTSATGLAGRGASGPRPGHGPWCWWSVRATNPWPRPARRPRRARGVLRRAAFAEQLDVPAGAGEGAARPRHVAYNSHRDASAVVRVTST